MRTMCALGLAAFLAAPNGGWAAELVGPARVLDGDTLVIGDTHVRLEGIDAPETHQACSNRAGERYACGRMAAEHLRELIGGLIVSCAEGGHDKYRRTLGTCSAAGVNLNAQMVGDGWAIAYLKFSRAYEAAQTTARAGKIGIWQGEFVEPERFRHDQAVRDAWVVQELEEHTGKRCGHGWIAADKECHQ